MRWSKMIILILQSKNSSIFQKKVLTTILFSQIFTMLDFKHL